MKIIFIVPSMSGGGAERVVSILANEFVNRNIETKILMTAGNECVYKLDPRIELFQAGVRTGGSILKRIQRVVHMRQFFKKHRDAILIAFEPDAAFFSCIAKAGLSIPLISSERNDPASFGNNRIREFAYAHSDRIVFQTSGAKAYFPVKIQQKGYVIENPVADGLPLPYFGNRKKTVVCVGRLEKQKNHMLLFKAFAKLVSQYPDYTLHLYGKGSLESELREFVNRIGMKEKVIFEGFEKNVLAKIIDAGMFVLSSDYEGISNSLLEAMAIGLPVISTDCPCGGSGMCIQNGVNGYLVPVGDEAALADAMMRIAGDEKTAAGLGKEAAKIRDSFSTQNIVGKWIEVLAELKNN